jgi:hypothetical protein
VLAAVTAWSAREDDRVELTDVREPNAVPIDKRNYEALPAWTMVPANQAVT